MSQETHKKVFKSANTRGAVKSKDGLVGSCGLLRYSRTSFIKQERNERHQIFMNFCNYTNSKNNIIYCVMDATV